MEHFDKDDLYYGENSQDILRLPIRRASFPFCGTDLPQIPKLESVPEHGQGIYSSVLFPPKSQDSHGNGHVEPVDSFTGQHYLQPFFCSGITNFSGFVTDGKFL